MSERVLMRRIIQSHYEDMVQQEKVPWLKMKEYFNRKNNTQCKTRWEKDMENVLLAYEFISKQEDELVQVNHEKWQIRDTLMLYRILCQTYREDQGDTKAFPKFGVLKLKEEFLPKTLLDLAEAAYIPKDEIMPILIHEIQCLKSARSSIRKKLNLVLDTVSTRKSTTESDMSDCESSLPISVDSESIEPIIKPILCQPRIS